MCDAEAADGGVLCDAVTDARVESASIPMGDPPRDRYGAVSLFCLPLPLSLWRSASTSLSRWRS